MIFYRSDHLDLSEELNAETRRTHTQLSPMLHSYENLALLLLNTSSANSQSVANLSTEGELLTPHVHCVMLSVFLWIYCLLIVLVVGVSAKQNNEVICLFFAIGYFYQMLPASIVMQCLFLIVVSLNDSIRDVSILSSTVKEKQVNHSERITLIEQRLSDLQVRIARAKIWSRQLKQPVKIDSNSSTVQNISLTSSTDRLFEVRLLTLD